MVSWLVWLLFGFRGRIPRKWYWLGQAILLAVELAQYLAAHGRALPAPGAAESPTSSLIVSLLFLIPACALTLKRFNDRGHGRWAIVLWAIVVLGAEARSYFGPLDSAQTPLAVQALLVSSAVVFLWLFIDAGFLRGERGSNRYGPDPLNQSAEGAPRPARIVGETIRDGLTGLVAAVILLFVAVLSIDGGLVRSWIVPKDLDTWNARFDNVPAMNENSAGGKAGAAGDYDTAIEHYTRAIELYGPDTKAAAYSYRLRGDVLARLRRPDAALSDFNKAIALEPDNADAYRYRGQLLSGRRQYEAALRDYRKALRYDDEAATTLKARGATLYKMGRPEEALADLDAAIAAADTTYDDAIAALDAAGDLSAEKRKERRQRAISARKAVVSSSLRLRGNIFRDDGDFDRALAAYNEALTLTPESASLYRNRGWLYEKQGKVSLARADYRKAAELAEPNDWLKRALERTLRADSPS